MAKPKLSQQCRDEIHKQVCADEQIKAQAVALHNSKPETKNDVQNRKELTSLLRERESKAAIRAHAISQLSESAQVLVKAGEDDLSDGSHLSEDDLSYQP